MTMTASLVLVLLAVGCFGAAAIKVDPARVSLTPLGLFFLAISFIVR